MEQAFTECFDAPTLNVTRWQDSSLHGLFHCTKGSAKVKASADKYCTMALRQNLQVGTPLPFFPGKAAALGAVLTMSQYPCNSGDSVLAGQCCRKQKCANYSGAHLVSRGCILYGTLEAELSVHIPGGTAQGGTAHGMRMRARHFALTRRAPETRSAGEQSGQSRHVRLGHVCQRRAARPLVVSHLRALFRKQSTKCAAVEPRAGACAQE
jgi:hypothetical protein